MLFLRNKPQWLIVGLGNPGKDYAATRHNVGFRVIDRLADELHVRVSRVRFSAYTELATLSGTRVLLMKPTTFMNNSGNAVRQAARYYAIPPERIVVISDDISLNPGRIRVRANGSAGGHNGLKSIIAELGSQDFHRVRIGVGAKPHPDYDLADWVLSRFSQEDEVHIRDAVANAAGAVETLLSDGVEAAASRYNGK
jgi:PTH1 family peptidyl-tRNA hydrolase